VSKALNRIEIINEGALLATSYFMFIFTEWVPDIELRYHLGFFFMYMVFFILALNFFMIGLEMFAEFKKKFINSQFWKNRQAALEKKR